ncbi:MAG: hypothetical protein IJ334_09445, partial [Clostridia bacterium]|nr:hypothetical protein [Clostridia bacterium]
CETVLEDSGSYQAQVCDGKISVFDPYTGELFIYDDTLALTETYTLSPTWDVVGTDAACQNFYQISYEEGITVTDLRTMEVTTLLDQASGLVTSFMTNKRPICLSYVNTDTMLTEFATLDLNTGTLKPLELTGDFYNLVRSDTALLAASSDTSDYRLEWNDAIWQISAIPDGSLQLLIESDYLFSTADTEGQNYTFSLYKLDGTHVSTAQYRSVTGAGFSDPIWSETHGGFLMLCFTFGGDTSLLFWDCNVPSEGTNLSLIPLPDEPVSGDAVDISVYQRAGALSETYGMVIKIADQCDTVFNSYLVEQEFDTWTILSALNTLETAFAAYPDGFFAQLGYGTQPEVEIQLVGTLSPNPPLEEDANGFTSFAAFVDRRAGKNIVVLDIGQGGYLEQNFHHELSHIIDEKLNFDSLYREDAMYSELDWFAMNPEDFAYTYDYHHLPETIYTDGLDGYFIDIYARTYPSEDRARVFEYAMAGADWIFTGTTQQPLRDKLTYYSACIRDCFDTTGWPDITRWEEPLN